MSLLSFFLVLMASIMAIATPSLETRASGKYLKIAEYSYPYFFTHFQFYDSSVHKRNDPTSGYVFYKDEGYAQSAHMFGWNAHSDGRSSAYIGVDHANWAPPPGRNSLRIEGKDTFNVGSMVVVNINHIPVEWGVWPAIWLLGTDKDWPQAGESDIVEYVHESADNSMTLHTSPGCNIDGSSSLFQGDVQNTNCNLDRGESGCSIKGNDHYHVGSNPNAISTAGKAFNAAGGGVYVHDWQPSGISVWFFPRNEQPSDLVAGTPNPSSWSTKPLAKFTGSGCNFNTAFTDMKLIINIDFCGAWVDGTWESSGAQAATGAHNCSAWVENNPSAFQNTYFDIEDITIYSNNGQTPGVAPPDSD